jgi:hypothetical protein
VSSGPFIQWQDLFVLVDDGSIPSAGYDPIESAIREQAGVFGKGVGLLCILPPHAKPPPDDVKRSVKNALTRVAMSLSSLAYVIEGTGFKGVAARAALVGMKIFSSRPYPIYVEISLREALTKMASHMASGHMISIEVILKAIADARLVWRPPAPAPARPADHELHVK